MTKERAIEVIVSYETGIPLGDDTKSTNDEVYRARRFLFTLPSKELDEVIAEIEKREAAYWKQECDNIIEKV